MTTWSPLAASTPGPHFDPTDLDKLSDRGGLLKSRGKVINYDTFEGGRFNGWVNHVGYATPYPPIGLTKHVAWGGSDTSLHLSTATRDHPIVNNRHTSTSTYKRCTRPHDGGLVSFSAMIAIAGDGSLSDLILPFSSWGICIDSQRLDNAWRSFFQVQYVEQGFAADGVTRLQPAWEVRAINKADGSRAGVLIPGSAGTAAGLNERKWNPNYVRLTVDFDGDGGHGTYYEFQVNDSVFDLRNILPPEQDARDHILENTTWDDFRGGFNSGLLLSRSNINPDYRNVEMAAGQCLTTFDDKAA